MSEKSGVTAIELANKMCNCSGECCVCACGGGCLVTDERVEIAGRNGRTT